MKAKWMIAFLLLICVVFASSGCTYFAVSSEDATRVWIIQKQISLSPVVYECCDACGEGERPKCWEATVSEAP